VPKRHRVAPNVLIAINTLGLPFIRGLIAHDGWVVLFGLAVHYDDMAPGRPHGNSPVA
jgi:hypothetical protein